MRVHPGSSQKMLKLKKKKKKVIALVILGKWNSAPTLNKWGRNEPKVSIKRRAHPVVLFIFY